MSRSRLFGLVLTAASTVLIAQEASAQGAPPAPPVQVSNPLAKRVANWDEFTGRFEASDQVEVRARVSGFIEKVHFRDGAMVQKGDLLGYVGNTGNVYGAGGGYHLHLELRVDGSRVDPLGFVPTH